MRQNAPSTDVRPFWRYYGGKWRSAPRYPHPVHDTIVEPFAGAAGYSCRWYTRRVQLYDVDPVIVGIWSYLLRSPARDILAIPDVPEGGTVDDLPVCQEARWLVGFWLTTGAVAPNRTRSAWARRHADKLSWLIGRARVAAQVDLIRHWTVGQASYDEIKHDGEATWFVDPPYAGPAGRHYRHDRVDFEALGSWCRSRRGQVIVCEQEGAGWLPFQPHHESKTARRGRPSREVAWVRDAHPVDEDAPLLAWLTAHT